jgi:hypothetical protein
MLVEHLHTGLRLWAAFGLEPVPSKWGASETLLFVNGMPLAAHQVSHLRIVVASADERNTAVRLGFRFASPEGVV